MIKAVIFDLDGTLLDTLGDIAEAHNRNLRAMGFPEHRLEDFGAIIGSGIIDAIRRAAPEGAPDNIINELNRRYQAYYPEHATVLTKVYDGMTETLESLAEKGIAAAVITNKTEHVAQRLAKHYFPETDFKFVWGNDGVRPLKPSAETGLAACQALNMEPSEIAFVGDSDVDMIFARNCGFYPVGAVWGYRGRKELERSGGKLLADSPMDILEIL